jgi:hypothetical protein
MVPWAAIGVDPIEGAKVETQFYDTMGYPITVGPTGDPATDAANNITSWTDSAFDEVEFGTPVTAPGDLYQQITGTGPAGGGFGPFSSKDDWADQFEQEHGRPPNADDEADAWDSFDFLAQHGRPPTQEEWENRWYTGEWFPGGGGGGGGGWGGGGGGGWGGGGYGYGADRPNPWWYSTMQQGI